MSENVAKRYQYVINIHNNDLGDDTRQDIRINDLVKLLQEDIRFYKVTAIFHNKDINENGVLKSPHIHINVIMVKPCTLQVAINRMADVINNTMVTMPEFSMFCNRQQVSCKVIKSMVSAYRYLIHRDNPEKYQYSVDKVLGDTDYLTTALKDTSKHLDIDCDELYSICLHSRNVTEVIFKIGLNAYIRYNKVIDVFMKERDWREVSYSDKLNHEDEHKITD